jgi:glycosyltransferase involved in cell wall biosynthesis
LRVLVITSLYPPHALGGYEKSCQDVVDRWLAKGHDVDVLTTTTRFEAVTDSGFDEATQPHVHRELGWYWDDHKILRPSVRRRIAIERGNQQALQRLIDQLRPDVVSFWAMGGMSLGLITTCLARSQSIAFVMEDDWFVYAPKIDAWTSAWTSKPRALGALAARLTGLPSPNLPQLPAPATVAFASDYLRRRATKDGLIRFTTSEIVPLGTDPADFPSRAPDDRPWRGRLLAVGRIEDRKGFDTAVRALPDLPGVTLRIVGPGVETHVTALLALAGQLDVGDRLTIDSEVPREALAAAYADADAFVFPSRWDEPFGMVPLEAMTQATPVIATRRGGSAEFLTDGVNCLEVPADDPAAIAHAVQALADDAALRRKLVDGGVATGAAFRIDRFADGLELIHLRAAGQVP